MKTIVLIWLQTLLNASKNYVKKSWNIRHKWALILNATSTSPQPRPDPFGPLTVDQYIYVTLCKGRYPKKYPPPPSPKKGVKESLVRFNWALSPTLCFCFSVSWFFSMSPNELPKSRTDHTANGFNKNGSTFWHLNKGKA